MSLPLERFLSRVSDEAPCGENAFDHLDLGGILGASMQSITGGTDEGMVEGGRAPEERGDWNGLLSEVGGYFTRTKHLGLANYALFAGIHLFGLRGLAEGITLHTQLLKLYWDNLHPVIENGDDDERIGLLEQIESDVVLSCLNQTIIAKGRLAGTYTLKDAISSSGGGEPQAGLVEASINETLRETPDFYDRILGELDEIEVQLGFLIELIRERMGKDLPFSKLRQRLTILRGVVAKVAGVSVAESGSAADTGAKTPPAGSGPVGGEIRNRADVVEVLAALIRFYQRTEPTSPVPYLLSRVKRVVQMDFMEIVSEFGLTASPSIDEVFGTKKENRS